jgi:hypothetical protein
VTTPRLDTEATDGLELAHVPPVVGDNVVVEPTQIVEGPVTDTTGFGLTFMVMLGTALHPISLVTVTR